MSNGKDLANRKSDQRFFILVVAMTAAIVAFYRQPHIAMWIGFALAGYSAIANDSIQTLGTFLTSNRKRPWWQLWLFIGGIMMAVFLFGWFSNSGDVAYGRLERIPQPESFTFLQLIAPVILLLVTRLRMPISTTFLLLSVFSSSKTISGMLYKTAIGYAVAFAAALLIWFIIGELIKRSIYFHKNYNHRRWRIVQWLATGFLWSTWLMQDTANVTVFLPRQLAFGQVLAVAISLFILLGILFYLRGGRIQQIITEKTDVVDVRAATLIDFTFAILLVIFKEWNNLPMSTTWVFLGLLAGRELALSRLNAGDQYRPYLKSLRLVTKDLGLAAMGLVISLVMAYLASGGFA